MTELAKRLPSGWLLAGAACAGVGVVLGIAQLVRGLGGGGPAPGAGLTSVFACAGALIVYYARKSGRTAPRGLLALAVLVPAALTGVALAALVPRGPSAAAPLVPVTLPGLRLSLPDWRAREQPTGFILGSTSASRPESTGKASV
jgi:hypothetical protein